MLLKTRFFSLELKRNKPSDKIISKDKTNSVITQRNYNKIFSIGSGKTGTTSLEKLLKQFGFKLGNQPTAEVLSRDWLFNRDASRIIDFCHTAEAF